MIITLSLIILELVVFIIFIFLFLAQIIAALTTDAPFIPVPDEIDNEILANLNLTSGSVLYDLGCGDARILIKAVKKFQNVRAVGVEKAIIPYCLAKFNSRKYVDIQIRREDIFDTDISSATHIFVYLYPKVINKLICNIKNQCKGGTRLVSCDFQLDKILPNKMIELNNPNQKRGKRLFIYII